MGRRALTDEERDARGNPGKRDSRPAVQEAPVGDVVCPKFLTGEAKKLFEQHAADLITARLLRATEVNGFARWCQYMSEWIDVTKRIKKSKAHTYETESLHGKMLRIHPDVIVRSRLEAHLKALEEQIGMLPAARQRIMANMAAGGHLPRDPKTPATQTDLPLAGESLTDDVPTVGGLRH